VDTPYPTREDADGMVAITAGLRDKSTEFFEATKGAELHDKLDTSGPHNLIYEEYSPPGHN
jgi:hypothetical protein